jgi:plasmid stability protein
MSGQPMPSATARSVSAASSASASSRRSRALVIFSSTWAGLSRAARWAGPGGAAGARCRQPGCTYFTFCRLALPMPPGCGLGVTIAVTVAGRAYPGVMSLTVHLPGEVAAALEAEAARRGQSTDEVAADLLAAQLPSPGRPPRRRKLAFAGIGSSTSGRSATDADDMLAEGFGRD